MEPVTFEKAPMILGSGDLFLRIALVALVSHFLSEEDD